MIARSPASRPRPHPSERADLRPWLALFVAGAAVRLTLLFFGRAWGLEPGSPPWLAAAESLVRGTGFALPGPDGRMVSTAAVPPLAPWIASGILRLRLVEPVALEVGFALLGALLPLFVAGLGMSVFGIGAGWLAGAFAALDPFLAWAPPRVEATAALAMAIALLATAAWIKTPRPGRAFGVGVLWGVAALGHAALLGLALVLLVWAWVPLGLTVRAGDRVRQALLMLFGLLLVVGPWTLRNAATGHGFVPVATGSDVAGVATMAWPGATRAAVAGVGAFIVGPLDPAPAPMPWVALLGLPFVALGVWRTGTGPRRLFQSLVLVVVAYGLAHAMIWGATAGGRVLFEPALALLAGVGADDARRRLRARAHGLRVIMGRGPGA